MTFKEIDDYCGERQRKGMCVRETCGKTNCKVKIYFENLESKASKAKEV